MRTDHTARHNLSGSEMAKLGHNTPHAEATAQPPPRRMRQRRSGRRLEHIVHMGSRITLFGRGAQQSWFQHERQTEGPHTTALHAPIVSPRSCLNLKLDRVSSSENFFPPSHHHTIPGTSTSVRMVGEGERWGELYNSESACFAGERKAKIILFCTFPL
jgi:hypothetical protein